MSPQISHADDEQLKQLVEEAAEVDDALDERMKDAARAELYALEDRREKAMEFAIAAFEKVAGTDLVALADTIESYLRDGLQSPDAATSAAPKTGNARAFVEMDDGSFKEVG